jgi:group I intron endonuclease
MDNQNLNCCGVYKIINMKNNKFYIGSSYNIKTRIRKHFELLKRNSHHSIHFQNAYNKYGKEVFTTCVLETCEKNDILSLEQKYLNEIIDWQYAYNMSNVASGSNYNLSTHPNRNEIIEKMSIANMGKHTKPFYIDNARYETLKDAAEIYNVDIKAISSKLKNWKNKNYYYENNPKIGEYNIDIHKSYFYKPIKNKILYYCDCGTEITKDSKYCNRCCKLRKDKRKYINPVIINGKEYDSVKMASKIVGIEYATLVYRINTNTITFKNYYYANKPKDITKLVTIEQINKKSLITKINNLNSKIKKIFINNKKYCSISEASRELQIPYSTIRKRLKSKKIKFFNYYYIDYIKLPLVSDNKPVTSSFTGTPVTRFQ